MSKWSDGTIRSQAGYLQPLPEYRQSKPWHRSYKGPPIIQYGPPLPARIQAARDAIAEQHRQDALDKALEKIRAEFGDAAVLVKR
jgi:hypothetical protein